MDAFDVVFNDNILGPFEPRYNISPSDPPHPEGSKRKTPPRSTNVPILRMEDDTVIADNVCWPLIPFWAKGIVQKYSTANARSEEMHEKKTYRGAWSKGRRCLIFATGFFEWQAVDGEQTKQPWHIKPLNEDQLVFGGLWERSRNSEGDYIHSCTIVTMDANPLMREIHNAGKNKHRMPLILPREAQRAWLTAPDPEEASQLIQQYPADEMHAYKVNRWVNNPNYDDPKVVEPIAA